MDESNYAQLKSFLKELFEKKNIIGIKKIIMMTCHKLS
jgi:hypothetical protein